MSPPASLLTERLRHDPIVITGLGAVSAAGPGVQALWEAVADRRVLAGWVGVDLPQGGTARVAGCAVPALDWKGHPWRGMARRVDAGAQYALHAARQAVEQAQLFDNPVAAPRWGVICGTSRGPLDKWEEASQLLRMGRRMKPTLAATTTLAAGAGALVQVLGAQGPSWVVSTACASGAFAIAAAAEQILLEQAEVMLVGGADEALNAVVIAGLEAAGVLARAERDPADWCRPFGEGRTGLVPGSGAGMLVLEALSSARRRGVVPLAVLSGWCTGMDPAGLAGMHPSGPGLQRTMRGALAMAGLEPGEIGYLNAHGTGTLTNDAAEAAAISAVFGPATPPVSSTKSITGHCLGATPALEAVLCVETLRRGVFPPALPETSTDPACAILNFSPGGPDLQLQHVLSNSAAFWGFHASLIFSRWG
jgi:3-oxoacyl-(acyl-carrier-protein) synthase